MTHQSGGREAGDGHLVLAAAPRSPEELRRAQLAVADHVNNDTRLNDGWEREADLMEILDALGLYRRI